LVGCSCFGAFVVTILSIAVVVQQIFLADSPLATAHAFAIEETGTTALLFSLSNSRFRLALSHERSLIVSVSHRRSAFLLSGVSLVGCLSFAEVEALTTAQPATGDHEEITEEHVKPSDEVVNCGNIAHAE